MCCDSKLLKGYCCRPYYSDDKVHKILTAYNHGKTLTSGWIPIRGSSTAEKDWVHWIRTFENFISVLPAEGLNKLQVLTNYVSPRIFEYIGNCDSYDDTLATLKYLYIKPTNEMFARHMLATRRQQSGETLDGFLQALKTLGKDCNFKDVTATVYRDEAVCDAFIRGLQSN